jgi:hypothetical protein
MKRKLLISVASTSLLIASAAFAGHRAGIHSVSPAMSHGAPHPMAGRIIAVRRASQQITLQTADGQTHEVKVPASAVITSHNSGSHFNAVRSGQHIHLTTENDAGHGLVARSLSVQ